MSRFDTTFTHRCYTLIGATFVVFECFFLTLYASDFWFGQDIAWLGIPTVLLAAGISHLLLRWLESPAGSRFFAPIWQGRPPVFYWQLVSGSDSSLRVGARHILWTAVDELSLTFFGNLQVRSRSICGPEAPQADLVVKLPLGALSQQSQVELVAEVRARKPGLTTNKRLEKRLAARELKGTAVVQSLGVAFMVLILLDLGQSTYALLEMNKHYYLCQTEARDGRMASARRHLAAGDRLLEHPLPVSWVNTRLLKQGVIASGVHQSRSQALESLGRRDEAVAEARQALACSPDSYRLNLRLARLLAAAGDSRQARAEIRLAIKNHDNSLLPRLYMLAQLAADGEPDRMRRFYRLYLDDLTDLVFGQEPTWPPGGNRFLHELFYSEDVRFVFDRLLGCAGATASPPCGSSKHE